MEIRFYRTRDAYGCCSNFSAHPVTIDGVTYPTSEHYFQAMKFATTDPAWAEAIRNAPTPKDVARMGRDRSRVMRPDWERIKDDVMRLAVLHKFASHADIQETLLSTGDEQLIEATTDDYYWGEGTDRTGRNMLGLILMEVRGALRAEAALQRRIDAASSGMEEDMIANVPSPAATYERNVRTRIASNA